MICKYNLIALECIAVVQLKQIAQSQQRIGDAMAINLAHSKHKNSSAVQQLEYYINDFIYHVTLSLSMNISNDAKRYRMSLLLWRIVMCFFCFIKLVALMLSAH